MDKTTSPNADLPREQLYFFHIPRCGGGASGEAFGGVQRLAKVIGKLLVAMQAERVAVATLVCPDYKQFN